MLNFRYIAAFAILFTVSAATATNYTVTNNASVKVNIAFYIYTLIAKSDFVLNNQAKTISTVDNITDITIRPFDATWGGVTIKFADSKLQNDQITITSTTPAPNKITITVTSRGIQLGQSTFTKKLRI